MLGRTFRRHGAGARRPKRWAGDVRCPQRCGLGARAGHGIARAHIGLVARAVPGNIQIWQMCCARLRRPDNRDGRSSIRPRSNPSPLIACCRPDIGSLVDTRGSRAGRQARGTVSLARARSHCRWHTGLGSCLYRRCGPGRRDRLGTCRDLSGVPDHCRRHIRAGPRTQSRARLHCCGLGRVSQCRPVAGCRALGRRVARRRLGGGGKAGADEDAHQREERDLSHGDGQ
jgi:hypothetical protein